MTKSRKPVKHHFWVDPPFELERIQMDAMTSVLSTLSALERMVSEILTSVNFPPFQTLFPSLPVLPEEAFVRKQVEDQGYDWESREALAVQLSLYSAVVRADLGLHTVSVAAVVNHAMHLGRLMMLAAMHPDWERGVGIAEKLANATNKAHGLPEEREAKNERLRRAYEAARPNHPTNDATYHAVAKAEGIHWRKVRRAVTGY